MPNTTEVRKWYRVEWIRHPLTGADFDERYHQDYNWPGFGGWGGMDRAQSNFELVLLGCEQQKRTARVRLVERSGDKSTDGRTHRGNRKATVIEVEFINGVKREVRRAS